MGEEEKQVGMFLKERIIANKEEQLGYKSGVVFFDNTQFIYELVLGAMELESFGLQISPDKGLRSFHILNGDVDKQKIIERCAYFKSIAGNRTNYSFIVEHNQTRSVNQYLTHWFYPYKGKFHPQMIRALINIIGLEEGETLLDPFVGSGTSALEALLLGINFLGVDISPLCVSLSRVKTESYKHIDKIKEIKKSVQYDEIDYRKLENDQIKEFFEIADMIARSDSSRRGKKYKESFLRNMERMIVSCQELAEVISRLNIGRNSSTIRIGDSRKLDFPDLSVDGIITSPPYSIALNYIDNDLHALEALGLDIKSISNDFIGVRGKNNEKFELYNEDMYLCYQEMSRVLKAGHYCVVILGNVVYKGEEIPTVDTAIEQCEKVGLKLVNKVDKIIFGLYNVMKKEYILVFQKL